MTATWPDRPSTASVVIEVLGRFQVTVDGLPLEGGGRLPQKVLALLKALVALGGRQVSADTLTEALWPDSEADQAYRTFSVTLSRLRRLIGAERLVLRGGRLSLDDCWVDAWAAEEALERTNDALRRTDLLQAAEALGEALVLYHGPFLEGEFDPPPILSARERLHSLLLRSIRRLGDAYQEAGQHQAAIDLYERGLAIDPVAEELYQRELRCLLDCGRRAEGLLLFERCRQLLRSSLGIEPAPETCALGDALNAASPAQSPSAEPAPPTVVLMPAAETAAHSTPAVIEGEGPAWLERRPVAVLFYAPEAEWGEAGDDPEVAALVATALHDLVSRIVEAHGGTLNQQVGDVFVAVFGLPEAHEDDTRRAVDAALELHTHLPMQLARELARPAPGIAPRAAISAGLVVAGEPHPRTGVYTLHGDKVLLAQRLLALAGDNELILGPESHRTVAPYFRTSPLPPLRLPGYGVPVVPHRVMEPTGVQTRFEAAERRGLSPLVGRTAELALLQQAWQAARQGHGRLVTLSAGAGMGKSRMLHELAHGIRAEGGVVIWGTCDARRQHTPYHPFVSTVQSNLLRERVRTREEQAALLVRRVRHLSPDLLGAVPYLLHLLSLQHPEHPLPGTASGEILRERLEAALGALLIVAAQHEPLVVMLEDWHWADEAADAALRNMAGSIAHQPLLIVVSHRPEGVRPWQPEPHTLHLTLQALPPEEAHGLMASVLGVDTLPPDLFERLYRLTEGNPFFIEELCPNLLERGVLRVRGAELRTDRPVDEVPIPESLRAVVRSRLDHLQAPERQVLQVAAAIGQQMPEAMLLAVLERLSVPVAALERVRHLGFLQQAQVFPEPTLRFHHAVAQTVVYESLLSAPRKNLHRCVAETMETLFRGALDEYVEDLALHYHAADQPDAESRYAQAAGDKAARMHSLAAARRHYAAALASQALAEPEVDRVRRIDLTLKLASVSFYEPGDGLTDALSVALEDARSLHDAERELRVTFAAGFSLYASGDVVEARDLFERCERMPVARRLPGVAALVDNYLGRMSLYLADFDEALRRLEDGTAPLQARSDPAELANTLASRILAHMFRSDPAEADPLLEQLYALAHEANSPTAATLAEICAAGLALVRGEWTTARERAQAAAAVARKVGNPVMEEMAHWVDGHATARLGEVRDGIRIMHAAICRMRRAGSHLGLGYYGASLAELCAGTGYPRLAARYLRTAERLRLSGGDRVGEPAAARARALLALPAVDEAQRHVADALRIARERHAEGEEAHALLLQAQVQAASRAKARAQARQAAELFDRLGMRWWAAQAEALAAPRAKAR